MNKIKEIAKQTLKELEKAHKNPYPLYYRNVFNSIAKEQGVEIEPHLLLTETINEKLLRNTEETNEFILKQNDDIKKHSKELVENIEFEKTQENTLKFVKEFEKNLNKKLEEYNKKIIELNKELKKAHKELYLDTLTKAFNRKALETDLNKLLQKEEKTDFFVMALDLDHFKEINDTYGHLVGDFVLMKFVQIIKRIIRNFDKIYRYGGDEFFIILTKIDKKLTMLLANKIVNKISSIKLKYKEHQITLTTSIGVTCYKEGDTKESLIKRADEALYESKKTRNKATIKC